MRVLHGPLTRWSARYASLREVTTGDLTAELTVLTGAHRGCWRCRRCARCSAR